MTRIALPNRRSRASSCSIIALATVLVVGASPAAAQSFQGTGTFATNTGGAANISTGSGTTDITVNPGQTVIDWAPTPDGGASGTAINFKPSGTTATFNSAHRRSGRRLRARRSARRYATCCAASTNTP